MFLCITVELKTDQNVRPPSPSPVFWWRRVHLLTGVCVLLRDILCAWRYFYEINNSLSCIIIFCVCVSIIILEKCDFQTLFWALNFNERYMRSFTEQSNRPVTCKQCRLCRVDFHRCDSQNGGIINLIIGNFVSKFSF